MAIVYPGWDDVMPAIQTIVKWGDDIMALPYDGDNHMTYYRKDALEEPIYQEQFKEKYGYMYHLPPANWSEIRDIAEFFDEWDWDNDGEIEYGVSFIAQQNTQAMWTVLDFIAQYTTIAGPPSNYTSNIFLRKLKVVIVVTLITRSTVDGTEFTMPRPTVSSSMRATGTAVAPASPKTSCMPGSRR